MPNYMSHKYMPKTSSRAQNKILEIKIFLAVTLTGNGDNKKGMQARLTNSQDSLTNDISVSENVS